MGSGKREKQVRELGQTVKTGLKEEADGMTRAMKTGVSAIRGDAERAGLEVQGDLTHVYKYLTEE